MKNLICTETEDCLIIKKHIEEINNENVQLSKDLDHITKEELILAVKKIADEVGVSVSFTYENKKNKLKEDN